MLAVLVFHAFPAILPGGYLGVDIFFVVSGFVITPLIIKIGKSDKKFSSLIEFYNRRFWRLIPALVTVFCFASIFILLLSPVSDHYIVFKQLLFTGMGLGNYGAYALTGDYFSPHTNPLIHSWSLSLEEQIYFILPIIILTLKSIYKKFKVDIAITILTLISFMIYMGTKIFELNLIKFGLNQPEFLNFYSPFSRFWEFGIGGCLYILSHKNKIKIEQRIDLIIKIIIFILMANLLLMQSNHILATGLITISTSYLLYSSFKISNVFSKILTNVGDASYSIYLAHLPLLYFFTVKPFFPNEKSLQTKLVAIFTSILMGFILYKKVELKFRSNYNSSDQKILINSKNIPTYKKISTRLILLSVMPIFGLLGIQITSNNYYGLNQNIVITAEPTRKIDCFLDSNGVCRYGNQNSLLKVALVGDSHAGVFTNMLANLAVQNNFDFLDLTMPGCAFIENTDVLSGRYIGLRCREHNEKILRVLQEVKLKTFVIAQNNIDVYETESSLKAIKKLRNQYKEVIYIGQTPMFLDKNYFKVNSLLYPNYYLPAKNVKLSETDLSKLNIRNFELNIIKNESHWSYIDSFDIICPGNYCTRYDNGYWLFSDLGHLSYSGTKLYLNKISYLILTNSN